jgi:hypothetical protein
MNETHTRGFAWQEGYGAFTVGISQKNDPIRYIQSQAEHGQRFEFILARDTAYEGPQVRLDFRRDQIAAELCGENTVNEIRDVGVGHAAAP